MHRIKTIYITIITFTLLITSCNTQPENSSQQSQLPQTENKLQLKNLKKGTTISFANKAVLRKFGTKTYTQEAIKAAEDDGAITYASDKTDIATVDNKGVISFIKAGTVTITATKAEIETETTTYKESYAQYILTIVKVTPVEVIPAEITFKPADKAALKREIIEAVRKKSNNVDLLYIDTSLITDMNELFRGMKDFNDDISKWDVSNVITMNAMFWDAAAFNRDISKWDVSKVADMSYMFYGATVFNGDISKWTVSSVTTMRLMFQAAKAFNGDISPWNVSSVITMYGMFDNATAFSVDLESWRSKLTSGAITTDMFVRSGVALSPPSWYTP